MGLYIKGLNMPKRCGECEFNYNLEGGSYEWWECVILHDDINQFDTRRTDCPLIEIPTPHGRLGDLDELASKCDEPSWCVWLNEIDDAPTILEAEE